MHQIQIVDGLSLHFPNRSEEFAEGIAIGALAALLATGGERFEHWISRRALEQARVLAHGMGYRFVTGETAGDDVLLHIESRRARPALRLVAGGR